jgi:hypothetical protein
MGKSLEQIFDEIHIHRNHQVYVGGVVSSQGNDPW